MNVFWLILLNRLAYKLQNFKATIYDFPQIDSKVFSF